MFNVYIKSIKLFLIKVWQREGRKHSISTGLDPVLWENADQLTEYITNYDTNVDLHSWLLCGYKEKLPFIFKSLEVNSHDVYNFYPNGSNYCFKKYTLGLKRWQSDEEYPGSSPRTHTEATNHLDLQFWEMWLMPFSGILWHCMQVVDRHTCRLNIHTHK